MKNRRFTLGIAISVLWLLVGAVLLYTKRSELSMMLPNAWGDFFAGIFAPLAFLWLVLGYLQQGEELNLSTRALQLQADELRNSVEQQRALVEVSRQQVESERAALEYERTLREESAKPNFIVGWGGGSFRGDGHSSYSFVISNTGAMVSAIVAYVLFSDGSQRRILDQPLFDKGYQHRAQFDRPAPLEGKETRLVIEYRDVTGREGADTFSVFRKTAHEQSELVFVRLQSGANRPMHATCEDVRA